MHGWEWDPSSGQPRLIIIIRVRLICALRTHIKLSIFRNIFSGIEKTVITFSILEKILPKNEN